MNLNSMLNGSEGSAAKKRKNSAHILNMLNNGPASRSHSVSVRRGPKRYAEPPIWAQSYRGTTKGAKPAARPKPSAAQSKENLGPGGIQSLLGLHPSFSGVLPAEDLNRRICEWLYGHLYALGDKRKYIEVEFKLGQACSKQNNKRIDLPVLSEVLLETTYTKNNVFFEPGISHTHFGRIEGLINQYAAAQVLEPLGEARTRDQFHPSEGGAVVRVSLDERDQLVAKITKQRVADLIVHFPHDVVDLRISLSLEIPFEGSPADVRPYNMVRNKNRSSWRARGVQLDLTSVITEGRQPPTKEVELEMDSEMILQLFEAFESKSDPEAMDKFEELTRYGLDNCRLISRAISRTP